MALLVNGEYVDDSIIRQEAAALRPRYEEMTQDMDPIDREVQLRDWSKENVIERVLLRQQAMLDTIPIPAEEINQRLTAMFPPTGDLENCEAGATRAGVDRVAATRDVEIQIRLERLIAGIAAVVPRPKQKEIADFYKKNKERFRTPPMVAASHIVKNVHNEEDEAAARAELEKAQAELAAGAPFPEVADRYSDCPGQGGALGWFPAGEMVPDFEQVVFAMEPGKVSDIFRSVFGWHIATVHGRRPAGLRMLDEVKDAIEAEILQPRQEKALEDYVDALRAKAEVKVIKGRAPSEGPERLETGEVLPEASGS